MTSRVAFPIARSVALRAARTVLTVILLVGLIWLGISQTNRANRIAARNAPILQPNSNFKQADRNAGSQGNQNNDVSSTIAVATFVVLLVQSWISRSQVALMRKQTDIYDRQAKLMDGQLKETERAASAARDSADMARAGVDLTRFIAERQLRAYVHIAEAGVMNKDGKYIIKAKVRNSGQTPAYKHNVKVGIGVDVFPFPTQRAENALAKAYIRISQQALAANGSTEIGGTLSLHENAVRAIVSGQAVFWIHGKLTYVDAFGNPQYTEFRQFSGGDDWERGTFTLDAEGNEST